MDFDERVGSYIIEWVKRHPYITGKLFLLSFMWIVMSISIVSICGQVGVGLMTANMTEQHMAGIVTDASYNQWNDLILPLILTTFTTMHILVFVIIGLCFISIYWMYKNMKIDQ